MRALVISGGGSKGAFAGGVAQYLLRNKNIKYDLFLGTSTGSLLIPHLALNKIEKIKEIFTNVKQSNVFNRCPFIIKKKNGVFNISINHFNILISFLKRRKTFGESQNLKKLIKKSITPEEFTELKKGEEDVIVTVSNLSTNKVEYKSIKDFDYDDFCDWIWISCNYIPFMSLANKNDNDYGDGGFTSLVPIMEAIKRGATEVDVIILETESPETINEIGKNPFSLMVNLFGIILEQVQLKDITIGKLAAENEHIKLNLFYTPIELTHNALVFNAEKMKEWWEEGFQYALKKSEPNFKAE